MLTAHSFVGRATKTTKEWFIVFTNKIVFEDQNEKFGFTQIPNVVLTSTVLNPTEKCIYGILRRYASMNDGAMPSVATICIEVNISASTYKRAIKSFIRSSHNPNPKVPLVTAIRRPNDTNIYKIHRITNELIELLKPAIAMDKKKKDKLKKRFKSQRKQSGVHFEPSIENTRKAQNEPPGVGLILSLPEGSNRAPNNNDTNNIDNNKQEKDVVVEGNIEKEEKGSDWKLHSQNDVANLRKEMEEVFDQEMTEEAAKELITLADQNNRHINEYFRAMKTRSEKKKEKPWNPVGALRKYVENDWTLPSLHEESKQKKSLECADPMAYELRAVLYKEYAQKGLIPNEN